jgi:hypothetical protein
MPGPAFDILRTSLEQFRDRGFGLLAVRNVRKILRLSRPEGWLPLRGWSVPIIRPSHLTCHTKRWGDAPVHSIGAALFARKDQIHFFNDIGYRHEPFQHCPQGQLHRQGKCWCDEGQNFGKRYRQAIEISYSDHRQITSGIRA